MLAAALSATTLIWRLLPPVIIVLYVATILEEARASPSHTSAERRNEVKISFKFSGTSVLKIS